MNPLVQLFALVVEQIPGVVAPKGGWEQGDREITATQVMFEKILGMCDKAAVRRFGAEIFGVAKPVTAVAASTPKRSSERIAVAAAAAANKKTKQQASISTYFADKMLVKKLESAKKSP